MSSPRSVRFDDDVLRRLDSYVRANPGASLSSVANVFVDEALRSLEHPGITFRPGPTGRRAGLIGGPDVWEVIAALKQIRSERDKDDDADGLVREVAEASGLTPTKVRVAVRYYAAHPHEIDRRIRDNAETAESLEAAWHAEQAVLRGR